MDGAVPVEHPGSLPTNVDDRPKLLDQPGLPQRDLPVLLVDVQHPALRARTRRLVELIDGRPNAVHVQHPREHQPTQPGSDDRDLRLTHDLPQSARNTFPTNVFALSNTIVTNAFVERQTPAHDIQ